MGGSESQMADTEQSYQSDRNQVNRDDIAEQPGHDEDKNPGDQRYERRKAQVDIHVVTLSSGKAPDEVPGFSLPLVRQYDIYAGSEAGSVRPRT